MIDARMEMERQMSGTCTDNLKKDLELPGGDGNEDSSGRISQRVARIEYRIQSGWQERVRV